MWSRLYLYIVGVGVVVVVIGVGVWVVVVDVDCVLNIWLNERENLIFKYKEYCFVCVY